MERGAALCHTEDILGNSRVSLLHFVRVTEKNSSSTMAFPPLCLRETLKTVARNWPTEGLKEGNPIPQQSRQGSLVNGSSSGRLHSQFRSINLSLSF